MTIGFNHWLHGSFLNGPGVYAFHTGGDWPEATYIGSSTNLASRLRQHNRHADALVSGARCCAVLPCPPILLTTIEGVLIRAAKPPLNRVNPYAPPLSESDVELIELEIAEWISRPFLRIPEHQQSAMVHTLHWPLLEHSQHRTISGMRTRLGQGLIGSGRDSSRRQRQCRDLGEYLDQRRSAHKL